MQKHEYQSFRHSLTKIGQVRNQSLSSFMSSWEERSADYAC